MNERDAYHDLSHNLSTEEAYDSHEPEVKVLTGGYLGEYRIYIYIYI